MSSKKVGYAGVEGACLLMVVQSMDREDGILLRESSAGNSSAAPGK
jgi:hypothetical protein